MSLDGVHANNMGMEIFISDTEEGLLTIMLNSTWVQVDGNTGWRRPLESGFVAEDGHVQGLFKANSLLL